MCGYDFTIQPPRNRRQPRRNLRVLVKGTEIRGKNAADVFVAALRHMGLERVAALNVKLCGSHLVSNSTPPVDRSYWRSGDWHIVTHCSTREKKSLLEQVAEELGVDIRVSIVEPLGV
jgi:hypothetical protein